MARPPYKITERDFSIARNYITSSMSRGDISNVDGYNDFRRANTPELLQLWCDDYLPEGIFRKLKQAVRAARKRSRDYKTPGQKTSIDIDKAAHIHLTSVAEELKLSLSQTILKLIEYYDQSSTR